MKNSILALVLLALAPAAFATDLKIAQAKYDAGFAPRPIHRLLTIYASGRIIAERMGQPGKPAESKVVGQLSEDAVARLQTIVGNWTPTKLVDLDGGKSRCTDAPHNSYSVYLNGAAHRIKARMSCHDHEVQDLRASELDLVYDALTVFERLGF